MRVHITVTGDDGEDYDGTIELTRVSSKPASKVKQKQKGKSKTAVKGPAGAIKKLYNEHFFNTGKSLAEIMKRLSDNGINFSVQLISMALFRAKYLTKIGSRGSYKFVQKRPPS